MDFVRKPSKAVPGGAAEGGLKLPSGKKIIKPAAALLAKARAKLAGKAPEAAERTILKKTPETPAVKTAPVLEEEQSAETPEKKAEQRIPSGILSEKPFSVFIPDEDYNSLFPSFYGETRIVLMARDSHWLFAYWEVNRDAVASMRSRLSGSFDAGVTLLRVYDVTNVIFDGRNGNRHLDVRISEGASSWYLHAGDPNRRWVAEIGLLIPDGKFTPYTRSNTIKTPADSVASVLDEEWNISAELMKRSYPKEWHQTGFGGKAVTGNTGAAGALEGSTAGKRNPQGSSDAFHAGSSGWLSSWSSPGGGQGNAPLFWLRVGAEIIIYGATESDAAVTMNGKPVKLASDGTFGTRFNLNDGERTITIEARSAGSRFTRAYTIDVSKYTKEAK